MREMVDREHSKEYIDATMSPVSKPIRIRPHSSLAAWRRAHGFDQREAATFLGISQSYYSKLESLDQSPRRNMAKRLTEKTGVPVDALMGLS